MNYKDKYSLSDHAEQQIRRRGLTHEIVFDVLANPDQEIKLDESKTIYQKIIYWQPESKNYLIRVIVNLAKDPQLIITAYKTSKINKYYEG